MNDLTGLVALQTRVYEFLERQDEATLRGILDGTVGLAVVSASDAASQGSPTGRESHGAFEPLTAGSGRAPSWQPADVVEKLSRLPAGGQRNSYLNGTNLSMDKLRQVAKMLGLRGYTKCRKAELVDLLASHSFVSSGDPAGESDTTRVDLVGPHRDAANVDTSADAVVTDDIVSNHTNTGDPAVRHEPVPAPATMPFEATTPEFDAARIAALLRESESEADGFAYLREQHIDRAGLLAVAAELQLTRVDRLSRPELEKRVLKQAIGARRKFAGLRRW